MKITKNTVLKRIDRQGMWSDYENTIMYFYEYILNNDLTTDRISFAEYDRLLEVAKYRNIIDIIDDIINYADLYEFTFIIKDNNKDICNLNDLQVLL